MIKFDVNAIKTISLFEKITRTKVKDYIEEENMLVFIVDPYQMGKAVGKQGVNVKKLESLTKKKIKIAEYNTDVTKFVRSLLMPLKAAEIKQDGTIITISDPNVKTKGLIIGRNAANLRKLEEYVKRHFPIEEIKVE